MEEAFLPVFVFETGFIASATFVDYPFYYFECLFLIKNYFGRQPLPKYLFLHRFVCIDQIFNGSRTNSQFLNSLRGHKSFVYFD